MRQVAGTARSMGVEIEGYTKDAQEATPEYQDEEEDDKPAEAPAVEAAA